MCFSAAASFTATVVLTAIGYLTTKVVQDKRFVFLSWTPFLFAVQQFAEGVLWLSIGAESRALASLAPLAMYLFLFFAFLIWPVWIPLSFFMAETITWRRVLLGILLAIGILYDDILLYFLWVQGPTAEIQIAGNSLHYDLPIFASISFMNSHAQILLYLILTMAPFFISSVAWIWLLGIANLIGFAVAAYYYEVAFVSVWCFFAALVSLGLYFVLKHQPNSHRTKIV